MQLFSKQQYLCAVAILSITTSITAKEISYDYVQGNYESLTDSSQPSGDVKGDAFGIEGSIGVAPNIAISARYATASFDRFLGIDVDATELIIGATIHTAVASSTDIFGKLSVIKGEIEASDGVTSISEDDTGNIISAGLRHMATDKIELDITISRVDIFDDTSNSIGVGARFFASEKFSLGIGYITEDDFDQVILNARFNFK